MMSVDGDVSKRRWKDFTSGHSCWSLIGLPEEGLFQALHELEAISANAFMRRIKEVKLPFKIF